MNKDEHLDLELRALDTGRDDSPQHKPRYRGLAVVWWVRTSGGLTEQPEAVEPSRRGDDMHLQTKAVWGAKVH